jgi:hypothetical protein
MNLSLSSLRARPVDLTLLSPAAEQAEVDESAHARHLRSLRSLFVLYASALSFVVLFFDGADVGCILSGIAGHVLWASARTALVWRDASWLERARARAPAAPRARGRVSTVSRADGASVAAPR